jgi:hypothetical protein
VVVLNRLLAAAFLLCLAGCDDLSPNGATSEAFTTPAGLRVEMRIEPGTISAGGSFKVTISAKNDTNRDLVVTANAFASNGVNAFADLGSFAILKNGVAANSQFSGGGPGCGFVGPDTGSTVSKTLAPGQEITSIPCESSYTAGQPFGNADAPRGEYTIRFAFGVSAGGQSVPPLTATLKIRD